MAYSMFPTAALQAVIASVHFLGVTALTFFFSWRFSGEGLTTREAWGRLTWPRVCVLLVFLDSYLFMFSSGLLIFGVGLQMNSGACTAGILLCVLFYSSSKLLIYAFLTEKVYIVWDTGSSRWRSPAYLICIATVFLYSAVVLGMLLGRIDEFRPGDGACVIGLKPIASIPLLSYDLYINILLTGLFLWPLFRSAHSNARLRGVATRTLVASAAALTTSTVNISVLTALKGRQLGWVCLASCATDVIFNAAAIFWVTGGPSQHASVSTSGGNRHRTENDNIPNSPNTITLYTRTLETPPSTARSFQENGKQPVFEMGNLFPAGKGVQIHVTTESQVTTSPRANDVKTSDLHTDEK
ncbi:hypothetical protein B0H11DRAFT_2088324 [Mycena galericulata]|nr:hypothetical protein B0H11DRAFT_2088324 [Mycena galericulata]